MCSYIHAIRGSVDSAPAIQARVANEFIKSKYHSAFIIVIDDVTYTPVRRGVRCKVAIGGS